MALRVETSSEWNTIWTRLALEYVISHHPGAHALHALHALQALRRAGGGVTAFAPRRVISRQRR